MHRLLLCIPLIFFFIPHFGISTKTLVVYLSIIIYLILDIIITTFILVTPLHYAFFIDSVAGNFYRYSLVLLTSFFFYSMIAKHEIIFYQAIRKVLLFHVVFFFVQYILYSLFGIYIDPIEVISGESQRYNSAIYNDTSTIRPTGLFIEPSTYSAYVGALLIIYVQKYRKVDFLIVSAILSFFLTLSTAAMFMGFIFCIFYFKQIKSFAIKVIFSCLAALAFYYSYLYQVQRFDTGGILESGSYLSRAKFLDLILASDINNIIFGSGFFTLDVNIFNYIQEHSGVALNDSSVFVYILIRLGLVGLVSYCVFLFLILKRDMFLGGILLAVSLTKINLEASLFILLIISLIFCYKNTNSINGRLS